MANRLSHIQRQLILRLLCEGNSIRSTSRITGAHKTTVGKIILDFGNAARTFLDERMRGLTIEHAQIDEMWTFVEKKQSRLTMEERETRHDIGDVYLWTCLDETTKLIPCFMLGKRSANNARKFLRDLAGRLNTPNPHQSDPHAYQDGGYRPSLRISTDAFAGYREAVDLAFGPYVKYGQLIKSYRNANMNYTPSEMVGTDRRGIRNIRESELQTICTSHVERSNLTVRTFMKRFARLTLGFSKKLECLEAACGMFLAHYNFVWRTRYPDRSGQSGRLRPPAAMMAGITDRLWRFEDLYNEVIRYG